MSCDPCETLEVAEDALVDAVADLWVELRDLPAATDLVKASWAENTHRLGCAAAESASAVAVAAEAVVLDPVGSGLLKTRRVGELENPKGSPFRSYPLRFDPSLVEPWTLPGVSLAAASVPSAWCWWLCPALDSLFPAWWASWAAAQPSETLETSAGLVAAVASRCPRVALGLAPAVRSALGLPGLCLEHAGCALLSLPAHDPVRPGEEQDAADPTPTQTFEERFASSQTTLVSQAFERPAGAVHSGVLGTPVPPFVVAGEAVGFPDLAWVPPPEPTCAEPSAEAFRLGPTRGEVCDAVLAFLRALPCFPRVFGLGFSGLCCRLARSFPAAAGAWAALRRLWHRGFACGEFVACLPRVPCVAAGPWPWLSTLSALSRCVARPLAFPCSCWASLVGFAPSAVLAGLGLAAGCSLEAPLRLGCPHLELSGVRLSSLGCCWDLLVHAASVSGGSIPPWPGVSKAPGLLPVCNSCVAEEPLAGRLSQPADPLLVHSAWSCWGWALSRLLVSADDFVPAVVGCLVWLCSGLPGLARVLCWSADFATALGVPGAPSLPCCLFASFARFRLPLAGLRGPLPRPEPPGLPTPAAASK